MWKKSVLAIVLGTTFLVGCNTANDNAVEDPTIDNTGNEVEEGINDKQQDANEGVINGQNESEETLNEDQTDANNDETLEELQEFNSENGTDYSDIDKS